MPLETLARFYGIQTTYRDTKQRVQKSSPASVLAVLRCLGVDIEDAAQARIHIEAIAAQRRAEMLEPVQVIWEGNTVSFPLRLPRAQADHAMAFEIALEDGKSILRPAAEPIRRTIGPDPDNPATHVIQRVDLGVSVVAGYHTLRVEHAGRSATSLLLSAPRQAYRAPELQGSWGIFLPLYALHRASSWGAGDFADLQAFINWTRDCGGRFVATLPLLASFYDRPDDASPYGPASRLFWNEMYINVEAVAELSMVAAAREHVATNDFQQRLAELRRSDVVDHVRLMSLKRSALMIMADEFFARGWDASPEFRQFLAERAEVTDYARFRAACETLGRPWTNWQSSARNGQIDSADYEIRAFQYHLYVQWVASRQTEALVRASKERGASWYLDLPLGVHPDGYDVWRFQERFAMTASGGAPPDSFFTKGQCWGFPPLHPQRQRESGYDYFRKVIRHHVQNCGILRIDHVMGLHRLFWVPNGLPASQGAYVSYPADELVAILSIESNRYSTRIIGENLGTVPPVVNETMDQHRLGRLYVAQYEINPGSPTLMEEPPANSVASLNTHDMPTFAAYLAGADIRDRVSLGLLDQAEADEELVARQELRERLVQTLRKTGTLSKEAMQSDEIFLAVQVYLAGSPAEMTLVALEDCWLETNPQNTPGTVSERVNWSRRARYSLDTIQGSREIETILAAIHRARQASVLESS